MHHALSSVAAAEALGRPKFQGLNCISAVDDGVARSYQQPRMVPRWRLFTRSTQPAAVPEMGDRSGSASSASCSPSFSSSHHTSDWTMEAPGAFGKLL